MKEVVIRISDTTYDAIIHRYYISEPKGLLKTLVDAVKKGQVLPKGHGKIGDLTKLYNEIDARNKGKNKGKYTGILALVGFADTIIEADKGDE